MDVQSIAQNIRRLRIGKRPKLSQSAVAGRAGISRAEFIRLETGRIESPRVDTLVSVARALGVRLQDLAMPVQQLTKVRFRSKKSLRERENVLADVGKWLDGYSYVETLLEDAVPYGFGSVSASAGPVQAAAGARRVLDLEETDPILDICGLLESAGVKVFAKPVQSEGFFGLSVAAEDGGPAVVVNTWSKISVERWIFTAAHELGHLILHLDAYDVSCPDEDKVQEREADLFASHFLMPQAEFDRVWAKVRGDDLVDGILKAKKALRVSYGSVITRLVEMGNEDPSALWQEFRGGYKRRYGRSLAGHAEPDGMVPDDFAPQPLRSREPSALDETDFLGSRLPALVREAVERDGISVSRAADVLGITVSEMHDRMGSWAMEGNRDNVVRPL